MSAILIQKGDLAAASFANNNSNNAGGITVRVDAGSTVGAAIAAAIASSPTDKFVDGLKSYDAATNILTLELSDNSEVPINMTALVADAVAEASAAINVPLLANDGTTVLGFIKPV